MSLIHPEMRLIEHDQSFQSLHKLVEVDIDCSTQLKSLNGVAYIDYNYTELSDSDFVVLRLIKLFMVALQKDIPVVLNRTGFDISSMLSHQNKELDDHESIKQPLPNVEMPKHFCIGFLTSGTTGSPKLIFKTLKALRPHRPNQQRKKYNSKWLLCYHPFSFAGFQVLLHAISHGETLISCPDFTVSKLAKGALSHQANAISVTPSMFKSLMMSWHDAKPPLNSITFGGEICEPALLTQVAEDFPQSSVRHIYATTETGVVMTIADGKAGFPSRLIDSRQSGWNLCVINQQLYLNNQDNEFATGDMLELIDGRYYFTGRADNIINVGGEKVSLEDIERQLIALAPVEDACVYAKSSPITGSLVCADVLVQGDYAQALLAINNWKTTLRPAQKPRLIKQVDSIILGQTGKKIRRRV